MEIDEPLFDSIEPDAPADESLYEEEKPEPSLTEVKPSPYKGRQSAEGLLGFAWQGIGMALAGGIDPPVGRVMTLQAPLAGQQLDRVLAGSFVDKLIQPLLGKKDSLENFGAIIAAPVLVAMIERAQAPHQKMILGEVLGALLTDSMAAVVPIMRKQARKEASNAKAMADLSELFEIPEGVNPTEALIQYIFANGNEQPIQEEVPTDE